MMTHETKLHYELIQTHDSKPTIVFESGYGWSTENWKPIIDDVARFANLFLYDRAGVGKSDKGTLPKDSEQIVKNLHRLLWEKDVKPPYIFVGHSYGGINARLFAHTFPRDVVGIVLLDACHEDQNKRMVPLFDEKIRETYLAQFTVEGTFEEFENSLEQVRDKSLGNLPLAVVTGCTQPYHTAQSMEVWMDLQHELSELSSNSVHYKLEDTGHAVHMDNPERTVEVIREMVEKSGNINE
ncbi:alpha/beta fold hydrolase [Pseudalkalibacillus sp. Hm43]|uniref:alpha/beta fold hydrolase n=1 Tax=Pseudalkalibacillus sp. Hm43 TaxID=3450742 RepID=UPI003F43EEEB